VVSVAILNTKTAYRTNGHPFHFLPSSAQSTGNYVVVCSAVTTKCALCSKNRLSSQQFGSLSPEKVAWC